jgi:class 3 adenylate cyclase
MTSNGPGGSTAQIALGDHRWQDAFDVLSEADRTTTLGPDDLMALSQAAWFTARADLSIELKERAFRALQEAGDTTRAAALAFDLCREYAGKRQFSIASAWASRGERLLRDQPETFAHGYMELTRSHMAEAGGDVEAAAAHAATAIDIGARFGDPNLQAWGLLRQGSVLIKAGRNDEGFPLLEEATIAAVNGELDPFTTGVAYCAMIAACRDTTDYRRASEWTEAAHRWCERQAINGFPGVCRVHRAEIVGLQGGLEAAELELRQATDELAAYNATPPQADGFYALGDVRRKLGDFPGAEEALRNAHALGRSPQPALALIRLAEGRTRDAATAIAAALVEESDRWQRARMLPAQVDIGVAAGDVAAARAAAEELGSIAETYPSPALHASAHDARARVALAEGDPETAAGELRTAIRHWQDVGAPYEVARDRVVLAAALDALDRNDEAAMERAAAGAEFERLGAVRDAADVADATRSATLRDARPTTARKTFLFTDIVGSTNLAEAMGDAAWEQLLRWHDDALGALFGEHGGEVVNRTGDGFFVAFDEAGPAVHCAIAVQRALAQHRRTHGFAPAVRVGVHTAVATRRGGDYSGVGVHVAARIAALAGGGEVLASAETAEAAAESGQPVRASEPRSVALKGVASETAVASIDWS